MTDAEAPTASLDVTHGSAEPEQPPPTIEEICESLAAIGEQALQTSDFISYSTLLDMTIGDPTKFNADQAVQILETLNTTLSASETLVYNVAWDIPEILLRYLEEFVSGKGLLNESAPLRSIMKLFTLLSEQGNPQELFLKSTELLSQFAANGIEAKDPEELDFRHENIKFCSLFELMLYSVRRIRTIHPSKFLLEAATTMLKVADSPDIDILTITTCLRRMYLLARDFSMEGEEDWSPEEYQRLRTILTNFLTYAVGSTLSKYPLHWAEKLYYQMLNKVTLASPEDRSAIYNESNHTLKLTEAVDRISQLLYSYDFDPLAHVYSACDCIAANPPSPVSLKAHAAELPLEGESPDSSATTTESLEKKLLEGPSVEGSIFLVTHQHFVGQRTKEANLNRGMQSTASIMKQPSPGVSDCVLYWTLWLCQYITPQMVEECSSSDIDTYLRTLLSLSSNATSPAEKLVVCSALVRILKARRTEDSFTFLLNELKSHSESDETVDALAKMMTSLIKGTPTCRSPIVPEITTLNRIQLTDSQRSELIDVVIQDIDTRLAAKKPPQVSLLSLLIVINTSTGIITDLCDKIDSVICDINDKNVELTKLAIDSLRKAQSPACAS